jgi:fibro-slime domain-containing protein
VSLDARAAELGMQVGGIYSLHVFFAERHTTGSQFSLETTISELDLCE